MTLIAAGCRETDRASLTWRAYETNRAGARLQAVEPSTAPADAMPVVAVRIDRTDRRQTLAGFGGALTESSGYALGQLTPETRASVIRQYFGPEGANYSLARVHVASCDFSLESYTYAPVAGDTGLEHFSIERDRDWVLPLIREAQAASLDGFAIMASPWTAPPWMKDNGQYNGGTLLPEHYGTFARYLVRYLQAYAAEGIDIWAITPLNEPLGNGAQWESMEFTPATMATFVGQHLGPALAQAGLDPRIFVFDQNRSEVEEWAEGLLRDPAARAFVDGIAVHWYSSTVDPYPEVLDRLREEFPAYPVIHSEGCIDVLGDDEPDRVWLEDDWYWRAEATDWGYYWAPEAQKADHPKYRPFYRYVRDLLVGINHGMIGWIDWNIVLDFDGGPNHANNFCGAPVLVDGASDNVHYTPLFYAMSHFSRFLRPGAVVLGSEVESAELLVTAAEDPDGGLAIVVFNPTESPLSFMLEVDGESVAFEIGAQALQTIVRE